MTTYLYETVPTKPGRKPRQFEIKQSIKDAPLTRHPETGEPIRRVMAGGLGVLPAKSPTPVGVSGPSCGCSPGRCCG